MARTFLLQRVKFKVPVETVHLEAIAEVYDHISDLYHHSSFTKDVPKRVDIPRIPTGTSMALYVYWTHNMRYLL